ncbi:MAG: hypothetical protein CVV27_01680 [Candidatus Melainabacteria bacterium HGW-Melainabacteria-1]|nr:MAG: hypothetical protein CVV27_01680 [Candidatus Melainabacteria bacterium HGW-Melainabacteria-1]
MQMKQMVRKQLKGINRQVKGFNRQVKGVNRQLHHRFDQRFQRSGRHGIGLFSGLLLLSVPLVAGLLLLGKRGRKNRESLKQMFRFDQSKRVQSEHHTPLLQKFQTQVHSLFEQVGIGKHEGKRGSNGGKTKPESVTAGNQRPIQTMGEV